MKEFRLQIRVKNAVLMQAMDDFGWSVGDLSEASKVNKGTIYRLLSMDMSPVSVARVPQGRRFNDPWKPSARRIADVLGVECGVLWPPSIIGVSGSVTSVDVDVGDSAVQQILERQNWTLTMSAPPPDPVTALEESELASVTDRLLISLTPREERVIRLRFGVGDGKDYTLEEVADKFGVSMERARQIEARALRKLRHPGRSKYLRPFVEGAP